MSIFEDKYDIMKKILTAALACILAVGCSPLRIAMDSRTKEGARIVYTTDKSLSAQMDIALGAKVDEKDTSLAIILTCNKFTDHGIFDKGDKMMFRLSDQSVIELTNIYHKEFERETSTRQTQERVNSYGLAYAYDPFTDGVYLTPYEVTSFIPRARVDVTTKSYALYFISESQIQRIIDKGVIKMRIEIEDSELDWTSTGGISELFAQMKDCLYERISKPHVRSKF